MRLLYEEIVKKLFGVENAKDFEIEELAQLVVEEVYKIVLQLELDRSEELYVKNEIKINCLNETIEDIVFERKKFESDTQDKSKIKEMIWSTLYYEL